ncbi:MAG TPA: hypothetical protein VGR52_09220 [Stellaceae bacterium]|nr:hypothetical protein [Stellaceae bacterium]
MHSAIFVASIPDDQRIWGNFIAYVDVKMKGATNVARLGENVWLVNVQKSPTPLAWLIALASDQNISHGLLPFEHAPEWLPGGFDPKTIQGQMRR